MKHPRAWCARPNSGMPVVRVEAVLKPIFHFAVRRPWVVVFISLVGLAAMAGGLPRLVKDPATDALIAPNHPSVEVRDRAEDIFGLRDPVIVALVADDEAGVFTPERLSALMALHEAVENVEGVRAGRVQSIASESRIYGETGGVFVTPFYEDAPQTAEDAEAIREAVFASPLHVGTLVGDNGRAAVIVAELYHDADADAAYRAAAALADTIDTAGAQVHVAGQAAVTGHLSASIDTDSRRLPIIALLVIFAIVLAAFFRLKTLIPLTFVIAASVGGAIGLMAWLDVKYYVITSALPIILIAISVADSVHILSGYFARRAAQPDAEVGRVITETMMDLWRPLTLTTLTTMAGFFGIAIASSMPPLTYFGWFALTGTFLAWAYTLFALPSVLALLAMPASPRIRAGRSGALAAGLTRIAQMSAAKPFAALVTAALIGVWAAIFAMDMRIDRASVENFRADAPIRVADDAINANLAGTAHLDVLISADAPGGLMTAEHMQKVRSLQAYLESLPGVSKVTAITDVAVELNQAFDDAFGVVSPNALPTDDDAVAELFLAYEASGDPEDLTDKMDTTAEHALVRAYLNAKYFSGQKPIVEALGHYLDEEFNEAGISGELSGRVNLDYHWMDQLDDTHALSIAVSLILVLLVATLLFRSPGLGLLSIVPVGFAILGVYAVMGGLGIFIEPGTSMFAAISIGVGVDFAIHFIDRLRKGVREDGLSVRQAIAQHYPTSARACFINAAALALGFAVLMSSDLPTLFRFGLLITVAAAASFATALVAASAAFALGERVRPGQRQAAAKALIVLGVGGLSVGLLSPVAQAQDGQRACLEPQAIADAVDARPEGELVARTLVMTKINRRGGTQERQARAFRANGAAGERRSALVFTAPSSIGGTAFMTHDLAGASDRRWLYLPSRGAAMRIPDAQRGNAFLGTGFSYEDIKTELSLSLEDYVFTLAEPPAGRPDHWCWITATPVDTSTSRELGYGRAVVGVDPETWIPMQVIIDDRRNRALKTISAFETQQIDGVWTALRIEVEHHQRGTRTIFAYDDVSYEDGARFDEFVPENLDEALEW